MFENQKRKIKYRNKRCFYKNLHLKDRLNRVHSLLRPADTRESADIIYRIWCMPLVCGSGRVIEVRK